MPSIAIPVSLRGQVLYSTRIFDPLSLFAANEPGIWLDPSDLTTMFQDRAGSLAVTTPGQSVGYRRDKSGRNNHAVANSDAARGIYGIEPLGGRRNLLTFTEQFDNAAWTKANITVSQNVSGPLGTNNMWTLTDNATNGEHRLFISTINTSGVYSIYAKAGTLGFIGLSQSGTGYSVFNLTNGTVAQNEGDRVGAITSVGDGWYRISMQTATTNTFFIVKMGETAAQVLGTTAYAGTGKTVLISGAQLETGSTATAYQRVTTQYDVTEAGKQTLHYVQYDGSDDGYVTPTITPGTDKVQVFAGVRKLSDAGNGTLLETSAAADSNNGAFYVRAPTSALPNYQFVSRGSTTVAATATTFTAPITNVVTGTGDISGDSNTVRVNGAQTAQNLSDQGTGNYLAYPLYIGRRGGTTLPFNGRDYGIITRFGANLDASTIAATESWLNQKTGAF